MNTPLRQEKDEKGKQNPLTRADGSIAVVILIAGAAVCSGSLVGAGGTLHRTVRGAQVAIVYSCI